MQTRLTSFPESLFSDHHNRPCGYPTIPINVDTKLHLARLLCPIRNHKIHHIGMTTLMTKYISLAPEVAQGILDARTASRKAGFKFYTNLARVEKVDKTFKKYTQESADYYHITGSPCEWRNGEWESTIRYISPDTGPMRSVAYSCPFDARNFLANLPGWPAPTRLQPQHYTAIEMEGDGPTAEWLVRKANIMASLPDDDSDIFLRANDDPREADMADTFRPLVKYMSRPEEQPGRQPIATSWSIVPDNDNSPFCAELNDDGERERESFQELHREIVPSVGDITRELENAKIETRLLGGEYWIASGDVEYGKARYHGEISDRCIIRIGKLYFSNGHKTEMAMVKDEGGPAMMRAETRQHSMLFTKERLSPAGSQSQGRARVNNDIAAALGVKLPVRKKSRKRSGGRGLGHEARIADLAAAYANTPVLPPVKKCPTGLPANMENISDAFVMFKRGPCIGGGSTEIWGDAFSAIRDREIWKQTFAELPDEDIEVIETAIVAKNYADIGKLRGHDGTYATKAGKRLLVAANENVDKILKKYG